MKKTIVNLLKRSSVNYVSKSGSLALFGEKKVPKELTEEYVKSKNNWNHLASEKGNDKLQ